MRLFDFNLSLQDNCIVRNHRDVRTPAMLRSAWVEYEPSASLPLQHSAYTTNITTQSVSQSGMGCQGGNILLGVYQIHTFCYEKKSSDRSANFQCDSQII